MSPPLRCRHSRVFSEVVACFQDLPDLDKLLGGLTNQPRNVTAKTARVGIDTLIYLKQALATAPKLAAILQCLLTRKETACCSSSLIATIISNLLDPVLGRMEGSILELITDSTAACKSPAAMRHQECFAIRSGVHGLLDVARKTFLLAVEDLHAVRTPYTAPYTAHLS